MLYGGSEEYTFFGGKYAWYIPLAGRSVNEDYIYLRLWSVRRSVKSWVSTKWTSWTGTSGTSTRAPWISWETGQGWWLLTLSVLECIFAYWKWYWAWYSKLCTFSSFVSHLKKNLFLCLHLTKGSTFQGYICIWILQKRCDYPPLSYDIHKRISNIRKIDEIILCLSGSLMSILGIRWHWSAQLGSIGTRHPFTKQTVPGAANFRQNSRQVGHTHYFVCSSVQQGFYILYSKELTIRTIRTSF